MLDNCQLDDPIDGAAACFRYDHYTPIVDLNDELKPIFDKEQILIQEIKEGRYTFEMATAKCKELYNMVPANYMVEFYGLYKAMEEIYPCVHDDGFIKKYTIPVGNISKEQAEELIKKVIKGFDEDVDFLM
jgi:hypothetical protein